MRQASVEGVLGCSVALSTVHLYNIYRSLGMRQASFEGVLGCSLALSTVHLYILLSINITYLSMYL